MDYMPNGTKYVVEVFLDGRHIANQYHKNYQKALALKAEADAEPDMYAVIVKV